MEPQGTGFTGLVALFVLYIHSKFITFILKCKIKIAPLEFYISMFIYTYLTPIQHEFTH